MSTTGSFFPSHVGVITRESTTKHELTVDRELDLMRLENTLQVSCQIGNRLYKKRVSYYVDALTNYEEQKLAGFLGDLIRIEVDNA